MVNSEEITNWIDENQQEFIDLSDKIWELAEIRFEEVESAKLQIAVLEEEGFEIKALKMLNLSKEEAEGFYVVHKDKPFFGELTSFITSGPVVAAIIEGNNAICKY